MITFIAALLGLLLITIIFQVITKMKIVGGNELGIVSGRGRRGFRLMSGGRVFVTRRGGGRNVATGRGGGMARRG